MPESSCLRKADTPLTYRGFTGWAAPTSVLVLAAVLLLGCELVARDEAAEVDSRLEEALLAASGTGDLSYYILPESDDFRSIPQDPANPLTPAKVELGRLLFHDSGLAVDPRRPEQRGRWSCA